MQPIGTSNNQRFRPSLADPRERAGTELRARGLPESALVAATLAPPGRVEQFLAGTGSLTPGIAFGLARLTGLSADYWLGLERRAHGAQDIGDLRRSSREVKHEHLVGIISSSQADTAERIKAVFALTEGGAKGYSAGTTSALLCAAMTATEATLYRAATEAMAEHAPNIAVVAALARVSDPDSRIAADAILVLHGLEPELGMRTAMARLGKGPLPVPAEGAALDVLSQVVYNRPLSAISDEGPGQAPGGHQDQRSCLLDAAAKRISSYSGDDPSRVDAVPVATVAAVRAFFSSHDTEARVKALSELMPRDVAIGPVVAQVGLRDPDTNVRGSSLLVLRYRDPAAAFAGAEELLSDVDAGVREVAKKVMLSLQAPSGTKGAR